ncbi:MAG: hypothetical protein HYX66_01330 [Ignavibacteria bacterium]|nr:hypothetical protein [Ignavibacteria bacterium]
MYSPRRNPYTIPGNVFADRAACYRSGAAGTLLIHEWSINSTGRIGVSRATDFATGGNVHLRHIGKKIYNLTDHLGSVKALVSDVLVEGGTQAEIIGTNDFDPYGGRRLGRNIVTEQPYRYGFQGMRLVDGLEKSSDYLTMFRLYNVRTGSWGRRDPVLVSDGSAIVLWVVLRISMWIHLVQITL